MDLDLDLLNLDLDLLNLDLDLDLDLSPGSGPVLASGLASRPASRILYLRYTGFRANILASNNLSL